MNRKILHKLDIHIFSNVGSIDTGGITMLEEVQKNVGRKGLKLVIAKPRSKVIKKLVKSKFTKKIVKE
ncbi:sulfate transporter 3.1-like [Pyrus ussuriensis x Pyrus communis]|uniref:Sulfate transporter 3.1-like n=1 Tax=Pyrus ussuriensis x Pyrus communis TaxID=2448454 RepID=A0A5N5FHM0_9ROSA|nr:sulfate transporter 3.1-like [Pyrus ussuriensis x Pyrus communis]